MERTKEAFLVFTFILLSISVVWSCFDCRSASLFSSAASRPLCRVGHNSLGHRWLLRSWELTLSLLLLALLSGGLFNRALLSWKTTVTFVQPKAYFPNSDICSLTLLPPAVANCWPLASLRCFSCSSNSWTEAARDQRRWNISIVAHGLGLGSGSKLWAFGKSRGSQPLKPGG